MHPRSRQAIERTPEWVRRPVALMVRTADAALKDRLPGLAAEIAFWVLVSLPALVLTTIAAASVLGGIDGGDWQEQLIERVAAVSRIALTSATVDNVVVRGLEGLLGDADPGLVSTAALVTIWTASRAVRVVLTALSIVYGRREDRPGWQDRALGFVITLAALLIGIVLAPLLIAGPAFGETLQSWINLDLGLLPEIWRALYWPITVLIAAFALSLLYHFGVPGKTRWLHTLPGTALATGVWLAGSAGLRLYGIWIAAGESAYGPLAGPVVVLLWLWLTGFAALLGGELNAQIAYVWPRDHHQVDTTELVTDIADSHGAVDTQGRPSSDLEVAASEDTEDTENAADPEATRELPAMGPNDGTAPGTAPDDDMTRPINAPPAPRS